MIRATVLAHRAIAGAVRPGDTVVDATVGNGQDTLFLARIVGPTGRVIGFDIQEAALRSAGRRVGHLQQVTLLQTGHEHLLERVVGLVTDSPAESGSPRESGAISAAMFNLGYLPGSSKMTTTRPETTLAGMEQALALLKAGGVLTVVTYCGHPGGAEEAEAVSDYAESLGPEFSVSRPDLAPRRREAPELLVFRRLTDRQA